MKLFILPAMLGILAASLAFAGSPQSQPFAPQRDPFQPVGRVRISDVPQEESKEGQSLRLRAVLYDKNSPLININGYVMAIGDRLHGYRLVRVEEHGAVLQKDGEWVRINLDGEARP